MFLQSQSGVKIFPSVSRSGSAIGVSENETPLTTELTSPVPTAATEGRLGDLSAAGADVELTESAMAAGLNPAALSKDVGASAMPDR